MSDVRGGSRLHELDAVRGLAALTVMFGHSAIVFSVVDRNTREEGLTLLNAFKYSPVGGLVLGTAAVIVFFVLSGLVLTLQLRGRGGGMGYGDFMTRRVTRIWIPYAFAVALAMVAALGYVGQGDSGLSGWFNAAWQSEPGAGSVISHLLLVPSFDNGAYDPVLWSLVHEMRISIAFPLVLAVVVGLGATRSLAATAVVALVGYVGSATVLSSTDYADTLMYLLCFVVGIELALHRDTLERRVRELSGRGLALTWVATVLLLTWKDWVPAAALPGPIGRVVHLTIVDITAMTAGAALLILLAQRGGFARWLRGAVPQYLGRISYSLYLVHAIVLLLILHAAGPDTPTLALLPLVWIGSLALATLMHAFVELPAQRLGRRLTSRRRAPTAPALSSS